MTFFYTPNLIIAKSWQQTLKSAFTQLRKWKFLVEDSFSFGDFTPHPITAATPLNFYFSSMTVTNYVLYRARYLKIFGLLLFSVDFSATLAAPLGNTIKIVLPATLAGASNYAQCGFANINNTTATEPGTWAGAGGNSTIDVYKIAVANYSAAATNIRVNGFVEVI